jgi:hypothetical protein
MEYEELLEACQEKDLKADKRNSRATIIEKLKGWQSQSS